MLNSDDDNQKLILMIVNLSLISSVLNVVWCVACVNIVEMMFVVAYPIMRVCVVSLYWLFVVITPINVCKCYLFDLCDNLG